MQKLRESKSSVYKDLSVSLSIYFPKVKINECSQLTFHNKQVHHLVGVTKNVSVP